MKCIVPLIALMLALGCKRQLSHSETEKQLKNAMLTSLVKGPRYDPAHVHFEVKSVIYFEDKTYFVCEFTVHMRDDGHDTTGMMKATISKDFSSVKRTM